MPQVRTRTPFAASFAVLLLLSAYLGLTTQKLPQTKIYGQSSDKGLHFVTFFLLTITFYWIFETSRRRCIHFTLLTVTAGLSIGSEVLQALLHDYNNRDFDPYDILANVVGSALALLLCSWYHKRMLERRRKNKHYDIVPGEEPGDDEGVGNPDDVELGLVREQETGVIPAEANGQASAGAAKVERTDVTEELDNWDENAEDWDDEGVTSPVAAEVQKAPPPPVEGDTKKRTD